MTQTAVRLRRLGLPHARARAGAVVLSSAGAVLAVAACGLWLAPRAGAMLRRLFLPDSLQRTLARAFARESTRNAVRDTGVVNGD